MAQRRHWDLTISNSVVLIVFPINNILKLSYFPLNIQCIVELPLTATSIQGTTLGKMMATVLVSAGGPCISARAKNVLQSDYAASILSSIDLHNIGNNTSHLDLLCQGLLFPPQKPKQVKSVRKTTKSRNKTVFKRAHIKFLAVVLTCLLVVWTIGLKMQLQELRAERSQLNKTVRALRHSSAKLEQMASGERSLVKAESLADTLKRNSIESTDLIDRLQLLLPETSWIKSLKMKQKTIQIQILDTENSSISKQLTSLSKALGNVELENNSNLVIDNMSLRARTFTIHLK